MDLRFPGFTIRPDLPSLEDWAGEALLLESLAKDFSAWLPAVEGSPSGAASRGRCGPASDCAPSCPSVASLQAAVEGLVGPSVSSSSGSEASDFDAAEDPLTAVLNILEASACQPKPAPTSASAPPPALSAQQSCSSLYAAGMAAAATAGVAAAAAAVAGAVAAVAGSSGQAEPHHGHGGKIKPGMRLAEQQAAGAPALGAGAAAPVSTRAPLQPQPGRPWASPAYSLPRSPVRPPLPLGSHMADTGTELEPTPPAAAICHEPMAAQPASQAAPTPRTVAQEPAPAATLDPSLASLPHLAFLTPPNKRKNRGGRMPAADPRLDPSIPAKRAKRIVANRLAAARSKLRKQALEKGMATRLEGLQAEAGRLQAELQHLIQGCAAAEYERELLLAQLAQAGSA